MHTASENSDTSHNENNSSDAAGSNNTGSGDIDPGNTAKQTKTTGDGSGSKKPGRNKSRNKKGLLVILLLFIGMVYFTQRESVVTVSCTPEIVANKPDVIMLGAWWCRYCYQAKKYFQQNKISYCEYDMENTETGKRLYEKNGGGPVPLLLIGKYKIKGFNKPQVKRALDLLHNPATETN